MECPIGFACTGDNDDVGCKKVSRYTSSRLKCADGKVKNPFSYGSCITVEERDAMFCNPNDGQVA